MPTVPHVTMTSLLPAAERPIATETLYRQHGRFVASFLRHMGAREPELDDMVQDVFLLAHRKGGYQPGAAAPRTWLSSLALRIIRARRRASTRRPAPVELCESAADAGEGVAQQVEHRHALERVQQALQALSAGHRAVFILFEIEGVPGEEIADLYGVPVGTIYSRLHHARAKFKKAYRTVCGRSLSTRGTL